MRVIARSTLYGFVRSRVEPHLQAGVKKQLDAWFAEAERANWKSPAELKEQFRSASVVSGERVVFNIKGNSYRLIVNIHYNTGIIFIRFVGTHAEYDKIDATTI